MSLLNIMQKIETLKNKSGESFYPLTSTKAVVDENGNTIEDRLVVADGEDLVTDGNVLRLKDRPNTDGMGYVILRKDKTFQEQVTKPNTIYEIRYDFDLGRQELPVVLDTPFVLPSTGGAYYRTGDHINVEAGMTVDLPSGGVLLDSTLSAIIPAPYTPSSKKSLYVGKLQSEAALGQSCVYSLEKEVVIPENCVLKFEGGSLGNGTVILQNTFMDTAGQSYEACMACRVKGVYAVGQYRFDKATKSPSWWNGAAWVEPGGGYNEVRHVVNGKEYKVATTYEESNNMTIFAPEEAGNGGKYILQSAGNGKAPVWADINDFDSHFEKVRVNNAKEADKALNDGYGQNIAATYLTKDEFIQTGTNATEALAKANQASRDVANQQATIDSIEEQLANIGEVGAASAAKDVTFVTGNTGLTKTNVQGAIEEVVEKVSPSVKDVGVRWNEQGNLVLESETNGGDFDAVALPSADSSHDGVLSKEDKATLDSLSENAVTGVGIDNNSDEDNLILKLYRSSSEADEVNIPVASQYTMGVMSAADKAKLDSLSEGGQGGAASGSTSARPSNATTGTLYFDTTLGMPVWWTGTAWVDALGRLAGDTYNEVRHNINGTEIKVISTDAESQGLSIYAPTELQNDGYVVVQQNNKAEFVDPADIGLK